MAVFDTHYNKIHFIFRVLIRSTKYVNNQTIHSNIYDVFIHNILTNMSRPVFLTSSG